MQGFIRAAVCAAVCWAGITAHAAVGAFSGLYVFGDSLSDAGNNSITFGGAPSQVIGNNFYIPALPYGDSPTGTYSNGPVWATQFAAGLGLQAVASKTTVVGGTNFAYGGARTATAGDVPSLSEQVNTFLTGLGGLAADSNALYVVAGGGNDVRDTTQKAGTAAAEGHPETIPGIIGADAFQYASNVHTIVDQLQQAGAQRIVVWNAPNVGLTPFAVASGPQAQGLTSQVAGSFNQVLAASLAGETGVSIFDVYGITTALATQVQLAGPDGYMGITNATTACGQASVGDCAHALFWDGIHPTTAAHALLAQEMSNFVLAAPVPEPAEWALLLAGLSLIVAVGQRRKARH